MSHTPINPVHWRLNTLLACDTETVHDLARAAAGTLTSYRLVLGRCLLALRESKGYKQFGCSSEIHYATRILGLSVKEARMVRRVALALRLLPLFTEAAELGTIAWSKIREITRKATAKNERYWYKQAQCSTYQEIEFLVRHTPNGAIPGDLDLDRTSTASELRCRLSPETFNQLELALRQRAKECGRVVMVHDFISWVTTSYLENRELDDCDTEFKMLKAQQAAKKDAQAAIARKHPLIENARNLAYDMELIDDLGDGPGQSLERPVRVADNEVKDKADAKPAGQTERPEGLASSESVKHTKRTEGLAGNESAKRPARVVNGESAKSRLRFNPRSRHTTKQQKKELYRRDAYCCQTPGCPNHVWLHVHHLIAFSEGGKTVPENLVCLCSSCHKNLHDGHMAIEQNGDGQLIFKDAKGNRLDRFHDLELASWLDHWLGWCGLETNSYSMRVGLGKLQISSAYFDNARYIKVA